MNFVPTDNINDILTFLNIQTILKFGSTSRRYKKIANDYLVKTDYPQVTRYQTSDKDIVKLIKISPLDITSTKNFRYLFIKSKTLMVIVNNGYFSTINFRSEMTIEIDQNNYMTQLIARSMDMPIYHRHGHESCEPSDMDRKIAKKINNLIKLLMPNRPDIHACKLINKIPENEYGIDPKWSYLEKIIDDLNHELNFGTI